MTESGMTDRLPAAEFGRTSFTADEARQIGTEIGIDWTSASFDVEQFQMGMDVELEHGLRDPATDVTGSASRHGEAVVRLASSSMRSSRV